MKMIIKKKSKRTAKFLFCASLCASFYPVQAKADIAEDIANALQIAGASAETIAAVTWQQAKSAAMAVRDGGKEWGADTFQDILSISEQFGVGIDALIPTVQGCIKETDGTPLVGVSVVGVGSIPGAIGSLVPITATTSGQGIPATAFGLPVLETYLSENQRANWGPGCYWMPIPPGLIDTGISVVTQELLISHHVIPIALGYEFSPPAKKVAMGSGARSRVEDLDSPFATWGESSRATID